MSTQARKHVLNIFGAVLFIGGYKLYQWSAPYCLTSGVVSTTLDDHKLGGRKSYLRCVKFGCDPLTLNV